MEDLNLVFPSALIAVFMLWRLALVIDDWQARKKRLVAVELVLNRSERGVYKRIDENCELMELLREEAPELLEKCFWIEGWLESQDRFLRELQAACPMPNALTSKFPRPWLGKRPQ